MTHKNRPVCSARVGVGRSSAHHGEVLQGEFECDSGFERALVTLPCDLFGSTARFEPGGKPGRVAIDSEWREKARRAAELTAAYVCSPDCCGLLSIESDIPVGLGLGSSTSECISACTAVADAHGVKLPAQEVARLVVTAETASDPLMFPERTVLFAQRKGVVLDEYAGSLDGFVVLGFRIESRVGAIDTVSMRLPQYTVAERRRFAELRERLKTAMESHNLAAVAQVASESARINQTYLFKERLGELEEITGKSSALGYQIAHSGVVAGLLFDATESEAKNRVENARELLCSDGFKMLRFFEVGPPRPGHTVSGLLDEPMQPEARCFGEGGR